APVRRRYGSDVRRGFVYQRVPHISLKSIANSEEIDEIHARWQEQLEPVRQRINRSLKKSWEEWEVPRKAGKDWSKPAQALLSKWWELRRERQTEINASITRRAGTEKLY